MVELSSSFKSLVFASFSLLRLFTAFGRSVFFFAYRLMKLIVLFVCSSTLTRSSQIIFPIHVFKLDSSLLNFKRNESRILFYKIPSLLFFPRSWFDSVENVIAVERCFVRSDFSRAKKSLSNCSFHSVSFKLYRWVCTCWIWRLFGGKIGKATVFFTVSVFYCSPEENFKQKKNDQRKI